MEMINLKDINNTQHEKNIQHKLNLTFRGAAISFDLNFSSSEKNITKAFDNALKVLHECVLENLNAHFDE